MCQLDFESLQIFTGACYLLLIDATISEYYCLSKAAFGDASW